MTCVSTTKSVYFGKILYTENFIGETSILYGSFFYFIMRLSYEFINIVNNTVLLRKDGTMIKDLYDKIR